MRRGLLARLIPVIVVISPLALIHRSMDVRAAQTLQVVAVVGGQPDDIASDARGRLIWGDLASGTVRRLDGRRVSTLARNLSVPEGIVVLPSGTIIVAEQGRDRIVRLGPRGAISTVFTLRPVPGQEGVDGMGRDPRTGNLLVPDSPNGTLLSTSPSGKRVRMLARGLGRPVDAAVESAGDVLVPDEHLGTLVVVTPAGKVSYRGAFSTPDDVALARNGRIWVTSLGDGGLWMLDPGAAPRRVLVGLANPQGLTLDRCGDPIVVEQNTARIVRLLLSSASAHCAF